MNNCIVTKLKGSVQGDKPYLNKVVINALTGTSFSAPQYMSFRGDGVTVTVSQDNKTITIDNKYNVNYIESNRYGNRNWKFYSVDWEDSPLEILSLSIAEYDVDPKKLPITLEIVRMANFNVDIKEFGRLTNLESIDPTYADWSGLHGNLEDFVSAQRESGRTSGSIILGNKYDASSDLQPTGLNYQGTFIGLKPKVITWTADSMTVTNFTGQ